MQITEFNKPNLRALRLEIDEALKAVAEKHGIELRVGNMAFTGPTFTAKVEGAVEGGQHTASAQALRFYANAMGLDVDKVSVDGYQLVGYETKRRSRPWVVVKVAAPDKRYVMTDPDVTLRFAKAREMREAAAPARMVEGVPPTGLKIGVR